MFPGYRIHTRGGKKSFLVVMLTIDSRAHAETKAKASLVPGIPNLDERV
jgi:hypothetical protein